MKYCNYRDITSVYSLNSRKLPGHFSYGLGTRLVSVGILPMLTVVTTAPVVCLVHADFMAIDGYTFTVPIATIS